MLLNNYYHLLVGVKQNKERSSSWEFIKSLPLGMKLYRCTQLLYVIRLLTFLLFQGNISNPKVLLTHIPLYRPDNTPCGPHRLSPVINQVFSCFYERCLSCAIKEIPRPLADAPFGYIVTCLGFD
jgi:hypothetical protein